MTVRQQRAPVITVSDRAFAGTVDHAYDVVLTTGGTGLTPRDLTVAGGDHAGSAPGAP